MIYVITERNLVSIFFYIIVQRCMKLYMDSKWLLNFRRVLCLSLQHKWSNHETLVQIIISIPKLWLITHLIVDAHYLVLRSLWSAEEKSSDKLLGIVSCHLTYDIESIVTFYVAVLIAYIQPKTSWICIVSGLSGICPFTWDKDNGMLEGGGLLLTCKFILIL